MSTNQYLKQIPLAEMGFYMDFYINDEFQEVKFRLPEEPPKGLGEFFYPIEGELPEVYRNSPKDEHGNYTHIKFYLPDNYNSDNLIENPNIKLTETGIKYTRVEDEFKNEGSYILYYRKREHDGYYPTKALGYFQFFEPEVRLEVDYSDLTVKLYTNLNLLNEKRPWTLNVLKENQIPEDTVPEDDSYERFTNLMAAKLLPPGADNHFEQPDETVIKLIKEEDYYKIPLEAILGNEKLIIYEDKLLSDLSKVSVYFSQEHKKPSKTIDIHLDLERINQYLSDKVRVDASKVKLSIESYLRTFSLFTVKNKNTQPIEQLFFLSEEEGVGYNKEHLDKITSKELPKKVASNIFYHNLDRGINYSNFLTRVPSVYYSPYSNDYGYANENTAQEHRGKLLAGFSEGRFLRYVSVGEFETKKANPEVEWYFDTLGYSEEDKKVFPLTSILSPWRVMDSHLLENYSIFAGKVPSRDSLFRLSHPKTFSEEEKEKQLEILKDSPPRRYYLGTQDITLGKDIPLPERWHCHWEFNGKKIIGSENKQYYHIDTFNESFIGFYQIVYKTPEGDLFTDFIYLDKADNEISEIPYFKSKITAEKYRKTRHDTVNRFHRSNLLDATTEQINEGFTIGFTDVPEIEGLKYQWFSLNPRKMFITSDDHFTNQDGRDDNIHYNFIYGANESTYIVNRNDSESSKHIKTHHYGLIVSKREITYDFFSKLYRNEKANDYEIFYFTVLVDGNKTLWLSHVGPNHGFSYNQHFDVLETLKDIQEDVTFTVPTIGDLHDNQYLENGNYYLENGYGGYSNRENKQHPPRTETLVEGNCIYPVLESYREYTSEELQEREDDARGELTYRIHKSAFDKVKSNDVYILLKVLRDNTTYGIGRLVTLNKEFPEVINIETGPEVIEPMTINTVPVGSLTHQVERGHSTTLGINHDYSEQLSPDVVYKWEHNNRRLNTDLPRHLIQNARRKLEGTYKLTLSLDEDTREVEYNVEVLNKLPRANEILQQLSMESTFTVNLNESIEVSLQGPDNNRLSYRWVDNEGHEFNQHAGRSFNFTATDNQGVNATLIVSCEQEDEEPSTREFPFTITVNAPVAPAFNWDEDIEVSESNITITNEHRPWFGVKFKHQKPDNVSFFWRYLGTSTDIPDTFYDPTENPEEYSGNLRLFLTVNGEQRIFEFNVTKNIQTPPAVFNWDEDLIYSESHVHVEEGERALVGIQFKNERPENVEVNWQHGKDTFTGYIDNEPYFYVDDNLEEAIGLHELYLRINGEERKFSFTVEVVKENQEEKLEELLSNSRFIRDGDTLDIDEETGEVDLGTLPEGVSISGYRRVADSTYDEETLTNEAVSVDGNSVFKPTNGFNYYDYQKTGKVGFYVTVSYGEAEKRIYFSVSTPKEEPPVVEDETLPPPDSPESGSDTTTAGTETDSTTTSSDTETEEGSPSGSDNAEESGTSVDSSATGSETKADNEEGASGDPGTTDTDSGTSDTGVSTDNQDGTNNSPADGVGESGSESSEKPDNESSSETDAQDTPDSEGSSLPDNKEEVTEPPKDTGSEGDSSNASGTSPEDNEDSHVDPNDNEHGEDMGRRNNRRDGVNSPSTDDTRDTEETVEREEEEGAQDGDAVDTETTSDDQPTTTEESSEATPATTTSTESGTPASEGSSTTSAEGTEPTGDGSTSGSPSVDTDSTSETRDEEPHGETTETVEPPAPVSPSETAQPADSQPSGNPNTVDGLSSSETTEHRIQITPQTNLGVVMENARLEVNAQVEPANTTLQWYYRRGVEVRPIEGKTASNLSLVLTPEFLVTENVPTSGMTFFLRSTYNGINLDSEDIRAEVLETTQLTVTNPTLEKTTFTEGESLSIGLTLNPDDDFTQVEWRFIRPNHEEVTLPNTGATLSIENLQRDNSGRYYAIIKRLGRTVASNVFSIQVEEALSRVAYEIILPNNIVGNSYRLTVAAGQLVTVVPEIAAKTARTKFQWYKQNLGLSAIALSSQDKEVLTLADVTADYSGHYFLEVSDDKSPTVRSDAFELVVIPTPDVIVSTETPASTNPSADGIAPDILLKLNDRGNDKINMFARDLKAYVDKMHQSVSVTEREGVLHQSTFYRTMKSILLLTDHREWIAAMDLLVDYFYLYKETVFRDKLRNRFVRSEHMERYMNIDDVEAFIELTAVFSAMADPENAIPRTLNEVEDIIENPVIFARFSQYYHMKLKLRKANTLDPSPLAGRGEEE